MLTVTIIALAVVAVPLAERIHDAVISSMKASAIRQAAEWAEREALMRKMLAQ